jgi:CTP:phosphocholine cytidylyltransferase-like protein
MLSSSKTRAEHAKKNSYLFNIKTGEWLRLTGTHDQMNQVVMEIIRGRHNKKTGGSDETFSEETSEKMVEMVKEYKK